MPRILQIGMHFDPAAGGADRYFDGLCDGLDAAGADFRAAAFGEAPARTNRISLGRPDAPMWRRLGAIRKLSIRESRDVDVCHFALYALPLQIACRRHARVIHFHGPWAAESAAEGQSGVSVAVKRRIEESVFSNSGQFVVLSRAFRDVLVSDYGCKADRVHVIPPGIRLDAFSHAPDRLAARAALGLPADRRIVVCVRRLANRMGLENLVDSVALIRRELPDVLLVVAGRGPLAAALEGRVRSAGLGAHVRLLGYVPDEQLPALYAAGDISVVPSVALEGFGLVTAESLACGTPCLVTPVGGLPDAVSGLNPRLILEGTGVEALASGIRNALTQPPLTREECQTYARQTFAWSRVVPRILDVYALAQAEAVRS